MTIVAGPAATPVLAQVRGAVVPPPVAPATIARDDHGQATIRATRLLRPLQLDGRLDEEVYLTTPPIDGFIQQEPSEGAPASENTQVWVFFDDRNVYVTARCFDSHPDRDVITELRRDNNNITQNESFTVVFDTFLDRRNGLFFQTTPLGALRDQAIVDDVLNANWNTVWDVRTGRFDGGWTAEFAIPFKSLRYPDAGPQVWGINFRRVVKWKNEYAYLTAMPASYGTGAAIGRMGPAGTIVGIETPSISKNLELKPYAVASSTTDRAATVPFANDAKGNGGFDFKYGLTRSLIADVTVRTDFAQVEEDVQQVNLTRFSLFFPEKRDFFLEGQGIFAFGGIGSGSGGSPGDVPVMFFSRQIGLLRGQEVPVLGGARVTGRSGQYSIGALNIETGDKPSIGARATNFSTLRVKRDVLRRSNIGMVATRRSVGINGGGANTLVGADGNFFLLTNLTANAFYARTDTPGLTGGNATYRGTFEYAGDRYGLSAEHLLIGEHFDPQVGYVRRTDFRRSAAEARFTPRPKRRNRVRKYTLLGSLDYVTDARVTRVENKELRGLFQTEFQSSDQYSFEYTHAYELIPRAFTISPGVIVPVGGYDTDNVRTTYSLGQQRPVSGRVAFGRGSLYNGTKTELSYSGRVAVAPQFAVEPSLTLNWVDGPFGAFDAHLVNARIVVTPSPRMILSSLVQYNISGHSVTSSARLRWEYRPGSDLFLVYSDGHNLLDSQVPTGLLNRSIAVKVTRLLRF
ncbi:MAG TPA: DUF5916 domain-containing protein [Vicinamibacterales bacterium]|nr:DUF5916 domain-containing protein [Vicinamibacterales bacterium]